MIILGAYQTLMELNGALEDQERECKRTESDPAVEGLNGFDDGESLAHYRARKRLRKIKAAIAALKDLENV